MVHDKEAVPGDALQAAHKQKPDTSWEPCNSQGIVFFPIEHAVESVGARHPKVVMEVDAVDAVDAVESLGARHPKAVKEVRKLAGGKAQHTGEEESTEVTRLF